MTIIGMNQSRNAEGEYTTTLQVAEDFPAYYNNSDAGRRCVGQKVDSIYVGTYDCGALKVGMSIEVLCDLDARATMDIDATIKGAEVNVEAVERIITDIVSVPLEDGVTFRIKQISEIMDEAEYPGVRVSMETEFDGVRIPLKIDISTGDVITPRAIQYSFKLMLEERSIDVWAYNLETVISRNITNTRMRDFYDIHILLKLYGNTLDAQVLGEALQATAKKRETERYLSDVADIFK